jgi:putative transposase
LSVNEKRTLIEPANKRIAVIRQCELIGLARSSCYYEPVGENEYNKMLMNMIDELYTEHPFLGSRKMAETLKAMGCETTNRKRIQRLMGVLGLEAVYPRPRLSVPERAAQKYPYLLAGVKIARPDHVWSTDITYVRMQRGFAYLVAVMDWFSRYVLSWRLSVFIDAAFCVDALEAALSTGRPAIFNSDQGAQFTSEAFTTRLRDRGVAISMDGRGRYLDNIFVERLWRSVKYEEVYLKDYADVWEAERELACYFRYYNEQRPHQSLDYATPAQVYFN